tara:strand:+ start:211 stop:768 length:558 start_codon:yes stop_codon:yes gene_type:complete
MPSNKMAKNFIFCFSFLSALFSITPNQKALADYSFSAPSSSYGQSTSDGSFEVYNDSMHCSSGGGTPPSLWVGAQNGNGKTNQVGTSITEDDVFSGGIAFNIPLGSPGNKGASCKKLLAILEAEEFLTMIKSLADLNILDSTKTSALIQTYFKNAGESIGVDITSSLKNEINLTSDTSLTSESSN